MPVFLPLRNLRNLESGFDAFIQQELDSPHLQVGAGFGDRLLQRGRLLLLLDGLDEGADPAHREQVSAWIQQAAAARPDCKFVLTSRFAGYGEDVRLDSSFLELHVRPLNMEQAETFVRNWYRIVETSVAADETQGELRGRERSDELVETLQGPDFRVASLFQMTRNPDKMLMSESRSARSTTSARSQAAWSTRASIASLTRSRRTTGFSASSSQQRGPYR